MGLWDEARIDGPRGQMGPPPEPYNPYLPWVDQLAQHVLLTVQALQRLHAAWDQKFTR